MAVIRTGPTISKIAGSSGDHVYSSWKGKGVLRSKSSSRSNPSSPRQATARAGTTALSKAWNDDLTDSQKAQWNELAQQGSPTDDPASSREQGSRVVIPQPKPVLSGYDAFIRANQRAIMTGIRDIGNPVLTPGRAFPSPPTDLIRDEASPTSVNWALSYDGVNEDVTCGNVLSYGADVPFAWEFWIRASGLVGSPRIITNMFDALVTGWGILWSGGLLHFTIIRLATAFNLYVTRPWIPSGAWEHGVVSYDGSNNANGMTMFIETVELSNILFNNPIIGSIVNPADLTFASENGRASTWFPGRLDCIRNYNRNLLQADVNVLYAGGAGVFGPDPLGDGSCQGSWPVCAGGGNTLFDISGNNYHGTLRNMEPDDWVPGKVPCPSIPGAKQLEWNDPADLPVGGKIRIWCLSYDAGVHRQHVATIDRGVEAWIPDVVRVANGAEVPIANMPGHYLFQIDAISPNGNQSPPSNTIEAVCPLV